MMRDYEPRQPAGRVEDFTTPFCWMAGVLAFMGLFAIWAAFGYVFSLVGAIILRWGITQLPRRD